MSIILDLPGDLLEELRELTAKPEDEMAITEAVFEFIRLKRLQELKSAAGTIDFTEGWREMGEVESINGHSS